ncbi:PD40 domain-containing protein [Motilibacter peucedani]|nr:PD40 domain-containing protein [Motilibacter peucedani]
MRRLLAGALAATTLLPLCAPVAAADEAPTLEDLVVTSVGGEVWQVSADGSRRTLLASAVDPTGATRRAVELSPDRTRLAYLTAGDALAEVHVQGVRGGPVSIVARTDADGRGAPSDLTWSGPSSLLAATEDVGADSAPDAITVLGLAPPSAAPLVGSGPTGQPTVDPRDPAHVVAVRPTWLDSGGGLVPLPASGSPALLSDPLATGAVRQPAFSPDGSRLAWLRSVEQRDAAGKVTSSLSELVVGGADGAGAHVLPVPPAPDLEAPVWAPDGSAVLVESRDSGQQVQRTGTVWRAPVDGAAAVALALPARLTGSLVAAVPSAPTGPQVTGAGVSTSSGRISLSWNAPADATVTVARTDGPFGTGAGTPVAVSGSSATDASVQPGGTYTYVLTATVSGVAGTPVLLPVQAVDAPVDVSLRDLGAQAPDGQFRPQYVSCTVLCASDVGTLDYAVLDPRTRRRGPWTAVAGTPDGRWSTFEPVVVTPGHAYVVRARGADEFGNLTLPRTSGPYLAPLDDRALRVSRGWSRLRASHAWRGTLTTTSSVGRAASVAFTGTRVSVLGSRGPRSGAAVVLVDGKQVGRAVAHAAYSSTGEELWTSRTLRRGRHVLTLRTTAVGRYAAFAVDGITVTP